MSEQNEFKNRATEDTEYTKQDEQSSRAQRRAERRAARGEGGWIVGIVLIAIGAIFMLQYAGFIPDFTNWWALFLLIPGVGTLSAALTAYRHNGGQWTTAVTVPLIAGLFFVFLTASFLFEFGLGLFWPLLLIGGGLLLLLKPRLTHN